jgi:hypothetical protein
MSDILTSVSFILFTIILSDQKLKVTQRTTSFFASTFFVIIKTVLAACDGMLFNIYEIWKKLFERNVST